MIPTARNNFHHATSTVNSIINVLFSSSCGTHWLLVFLSVPFSLAYSPRKKRFSIMESRFLTEIESRELHSHIKNRISFYGSISHNNNKKMCTISIRFGELWVEKFNLMFNSNSHPFFIFNFSASHTYELVNKENEKKNVSKNRKKKWDGSVISFFFSSIYVIMLSECDFYGERGGMRWSCSEAKLHLFNLVLCIESGWGGEDG